MVGGKIAVTKQCHVGVQTQPIKFHVDSVNHVVWTTDLRQGRSESNAGTGKGPAHLLNEALEVAEDSRDGPDPHAIGSHVNNNFFQLWVIFIGQKIRQFCYRHAWKRARSGLSSPVKSVRPYTAKVGVANDEVDCTIDVEGCARWGAPSVPCRWWLADLIAT